jgi:hypothetical protein
VRARKGLDATRYGDAGAALRNAVDAVNRATIVGQDLEFLAEEQIPAESKDVQPLQRALRVARDEIRTALSALSDLAKEDATNVTVTVDALVSKACARAGGAA